MQSEILYQLSKFLGITIGLLPENGGTVMQLAPSSAPRSFFDKSAYSQMSVLVLSKSKQQSKALENIGNICKKIDTLNLPEADNWQIKTIEVSTSPNFVGQEKNENGIMWIYSCMLQVNYYKNRNEE